MISETELVGKALIGEKLDIYFAYPGGQKIDLFDAFHQREEFCVILPRHEQGLTLATAGDAQSTGEVGVYLVTMRLGARILITGIATTDYDLSPLVCITGQVSTYLIGKDAFPEVDLLEICR